MKTLYKQKEDIETHEKTKARQRAHNDCFTDVYHGLEVLRSRQYWCAPYSLTFLLAWISSSSFHTLFPCNLFLTSVISLNIVSLFLHTCYVLSSLLKSSIVWFSSSRSQKVVTCSLYCWTLSLAWISSSCSLAVVICSLSSSQGSFAWISSS